MNCKKLVDLLSEYVDGNLEKEISGHLESHLHDCPDCDEFLSQFRKTITWTHTCMQEKLAIPAEMETRLSVFITKLESGEFDDRDILEGDAKKGKARSIFDTTILDQAGMDLDHGKNCQHKHDH